uniref:UDP-glycosyltransferases domain-containing protein n=1 Tax=Oryza punctata TaxID=4537 RepID=A0A0E0JMK3_ORYPU
MSQETPARRSPPHVLLVSAPLQGHVNPLLCLGRRLSSRGLLVTFTTVPHDGLKLKLQPNDDGAAMDVGSGRLRFEPLRGGRLWTPADPRYRVPDDMQRHIQDAGPAALEGLIRRQAGVGRPVSFIVANAFAPWAAGVARDMGVPRAMLWTQSCVVLSLYYHHLHSLVAFPPVGAETDLPVPVPGLPALTVGELPALVYAPEQHVWRQALVADLLSLHETLPWVLVNTFDELERVAIEALRVHLPVVPVGPLFETGNGAGEDDDCVAWLDAQPPRSVVFVAFGSVVVIGRDETAEVAEGLASTGHPFLWVVRDDSRELHPHGESGGGKGKVVAWCEQRRVLEHPAVGCFVTHCGWNSTTEALAAGVPVVAYPAWSDQITNAKLLADVYGVGVRLPVPPTRDALRRCVDEVMSGPEAEAMQLRAREWRDKASAAVADGGSSDMGIRDFADALLSLSAELGCTTAVQPRAASEMSQESAAAAATGMAPAPAKAKAQPHVLLVSSSFQSHVNPLLRLGRRLAAKGLRVTFTTALRDGIRLFDDGDDNDGVRVERLRGGGMWEPDDPRLRVPGDMARHVEAAGPAALVELIRLEAEAGRPVACVVANAFVSWAVRVAGDVGLPCAILWIQSCAVLSVYYHYVYSLAAFPSGDEADSSGAVTIPGLPELDMDELRPLLIYTSGQEMWRQMLVGDLGSMTEKAPCVFVNTFDELEHEAIVGLRKHIPLIPIGPLVEPDDDGGVVDSSSTAAAHDVHGCTAWLDAQPRRSVVFVAFGSLVDIGHDEVVEIAEGLGSTGRPFLWVLRDGNRALLPEEALDAVAAAACRGDRGKVVPWCEQRRVLAHGAVGCFVTHCGWNSTAEALAAGVPMVASPRWSDQRINTRFVVDVYRVGVRAPGTPLTREALRLSVEEVTVGPEAEAMAARAAILGEKARAAVGDGGSSDRGVQAFIDRITSGGAEQ